MILFFGAIVKNVFETQGRMKSVINRCTARTVPSTKLVKIKTPAEH
jgi:hypothetical protein